MVIYKGIIMLQRNVKLGRKLNISNWRKTAYGSWSMTGDCQVYSLQTVDASAALELINSKSDITLTHIIGKSVGKMIESNRQINRLIRFGNFYEREDISVFFQVSVDSNGKDLSGHTVRSINTKTLSDISSEMNKVVKRVKSGDDFEYKKVKKTMGFIPNLFIPFIIWAYGFLLYGLNLWSKLIGAPRDSFGSVMVTNVGSLGVQTAFAPLVPYSRVPLILSFGKVYQKPVVKNGEIVIQDSIDCCWTCDHRLIDGVIGARMMKSFEEHFTSPQEL